MIGIKSLAVTNFRCFNSLDLSFEHNKINLITGLNGSGKTSVLEAVYLLSCGKSFRANGVGGLFGKNLGGEKNNLDLFTVKAEISKNNVCHFIYYLRTKTSNQRKLLLNSHPVKSASELAHIFPVCNIAADNFHLITSSPDFRRRLLDWAMFHVKHHDFMSSWQGYNNILQQRNKLLKNNGVSLELFKTWDEMFAVSASRLINMRDEFIKLLQPIFNKYNKIFFKNTISNTLKISHGIDSKQKTQDLQDIKYIVDILNKKLELDMLRGYTSIGPHRADIKFSTNHYSSKGLVSRGQEKLIIIALYLSLLEVIDIYGSKRPVIMIDDVAAELDNNYLGLFYEEIARLSLKHQILVTSLDNNIQSQFLGKNVNHISL